MQWSPLNENVDDECTQKGGKAGSHRNNEEQIDLDLKKKKRKEEKKTNERRKEELEKKGKKKDKKKEQKPTVAANNTKLQATIF